MIIAPKLKLFLIIVLASLPFSGLFWPIKKIYAENHLKSTLKEVTENVQEISEVKNDDTLTQKEKEGKDLMARQRTLEKIFDLTLLENDDLKNRLNEIKNIGLSEEQEKIRLALLNLLDENENAYQEMRKRLKEADNSEEIKQLAADFKNWRNLVYNPKVEKIIAFNLVFQGKNIIAIANNRLNKIRGDLGKLNENSNHFEWADDLLYKAGLKIKKAEDLNVLAENLVIQEIHKDKNPGFFKKLFFRNQIPAVKSLIEESNQKIKSAYQIFIELGRAINEANK